MRTLYSPNGTAAYHDGLMVAAHLSMRTTPRYEIFVTHPGTTAAVKLTDSSPLYRGAIKEIEQGGGLAVGETGRWESEGVKFVARRA